MHEQRVDGAKERSGISPMMILFIVLGVLAVVFILQNSDSQEINFLFFEFRAPLWVILFGLLVLGALLDRLVTYWMKRRKARQVAAD